MILFKNVNTINLSFHIGGKLILFILSDDALTISLTFVNEDQREKISVIKLLNKTKAKLAFIYNSVDYPEKKKTIGCIGEVDRSKAKAKRSSNH